MRFFLSSVLIALLFLASAEKSYAQFNGSLQMGYVSSSNVEKQDTTGADHALLPAFSLSYGLPVSPLAQLDFSAAVLPYLYKKASHAFTQSSFSLEGKYYLSNIAAIRAERMATDLATTSSTNAAVSSAASTLATTATSNPASTVSTTTTTAVTGTPTGSTPSPFEQTQAALAISSNDSLLQNAISYLYVLGSSLDSIDYSAVKSLNKVQRISMESHRDSLSDLLFSLGDILDSLDFSQSVKSVAVDELTELRPLLTTVNTPLGNPSYRKEWLESAIHYLELTKPEEDFLILAASASSTDQEMIKTVSQTSTTLGSVGLAAIAAQRAAEQEVTAPLFTLVSSSARQHYLSAQDFSIAEDAPLQTAKTFASMIDIPAVYQIHSPKQDSTVLYRILEVGPSFEFYLGNSGSLRLSYDFVNTQFPNDSVYSNNENRLRLGGRTSLTSSTTMFGEVGYGTKHYLNPLQIVVGGGPLHKLQTQQTASDFSQFTVGLGIAQFIGDRVTVGVSGGLSSSPNLRAYITTFNGRNPLASQISDDEYTFDYKRLLLFTVTRIFWDIDLALDYAHENRQYGSVLQKPRPGVEAKLGGDRIENGNYYSLDLSKFYVFDDRLISVFNSLLLEASISNAHVSSSLSQYSYKDFSVSLSAALGF